MTKAITILGATGSVGASTLSIIRENRNSFEIVGLTSHSNAELLAALAVEFAPKYVVLSDVRHIAVLEQKLVATDIQILTGEEGLEFLAIQKADLVVAAITGFAGFKPVFAAINAGTDIALANKEALVAGGHLLMPLATQKGVTLLPIDSEHNAIFQCMMGQKWDHVEQVTLTASGGPFLSMTSQEMYHVPPSRALKHPTWSMGAKITIDSATMMNKGFESLEAAWLFGLDKKQICAIIHPQSIMHGFVKFKDESVIAHLAPTDMKVPISHALGWPERLKITCEKLKLTQISNLEFTEIKEDQFPSYNLAYQLIGDNPCYAIALNAANEIAVALYLNKQVSFGDIYKINAKTIDLIKLTELPDYHSIIDYNNYARNIAHSILPSL
ncbi:1-deoxy-D-xylulose-5-phosphate reductoisomerase [Alphaproteobacteria bacterium]|nr:1-deoxy-D-xylulose-5-phosphate reductoisomerase [Alphaproteobacteria bacterium]